MPIKRGKAQVSIKAKFPQKITISGLKLFNRPGYFLLESGVLYWISATNEKEANILLLRKYGELDNDWKFRACEYINNRSYKGLSKIIITPSMYKAIMFPVLLLFVVLFSTNPFFFNANFFRSDCFSITGTLLNLPQRQCKNLYVVVHYQKFDTGFWQSEKKAIDKRMLTGNCLSFGLCGDEMKKVQRYYLDWNSDN
jgi:hypothetical protein